MEIEHREQRKQRGHRALQHPGAPLVFELVFMLQCDRPMRL